MAQLINITFFIRNYTRDILLWNKFFKKSSILGDNCEKPFAVGIDILKEGRRLATKVNATFFVGNEVLNIFYLTIVSKKKKKKTKNNIFQNNGEI